MPDQGITYRTYQGIHQVPTEAWDGLAIKASLVYTSDYWRLIEDSAIGCFYDFHYIMVSRQETPVCLAACYFFKVDVNEYLNRILARAIQYIRRLFPEFLRVKILECGTPLNTQLPPFLASVEDKGEDVLACLGSALQDLAREHKVRFIGVKDINGALLRQYSASAIFKGWSMVESVPGAYVDIKWRGIDEYLDSMKSYYRSKLNKHLKINAERNVTCTVVEDFAGFSDALAKQWLVVNKGVKGSKGEIINAEFYKNICVEFDADAKALLFYAEGKMIGHALVIRDYKVLRWLYVGREKKVNDSLYQLMMYKVIEVGIALNVEQIDCGPTTYDVKRDLGARIEPLYYALKCNLPVPYKWIDPIVRKMLKTKSPVTKDVFKVN